MSDTKPAAPAAKKSAITLLSPLGLKLEVIGMGAPQGPLGNVQTVRVKRLNDGGVRDLPLSELERINSAVRVKAAIDQAAQAKKEAAAREQAALDEELKQTE